MNNNNNENGSTCFIERKINNKMRYFANAQEADIAQREMEIMGNKDYMQYITYDKPAQAYKLRYKDTDARFKTLNEAIAAREIRKQAMKSDTIDVNVTLEQYLEKLHGKIETENSKTVGTYIEDITRAYGPLLKKKMLDITRAELEKGLRDLQNGTVRKGKYKNVPIAPSTIRRTFTEIRQVYKCFGEELNILPEKLPTISMKIPKKRYNKYKKNDKIAFDLDLLKKMTEAAKTYHKNKSLCNRFAALISLMVATGMRISEALCVDRNDIEMMDRSDDENSDNIAMLITVRHSIHDVKKVQQKEGLPFYIGPTKNGKERTVPITDEQTVKLIQKVIEEEHPKYSYKGDEYDFLFATSTGTPLSYHNFRREYNKIRAQVDFSSYDHPCKPHEIRHSVATALAHTPGLSYADAAEFLGHSLEVFMNTYVHATNDGIWSCATAITNKGTLNKTVDADAEAQVDSNDQQPVVNHPTPIYVVKEPSIIYGATPLTPAETNKTA